MYSAIWGQSEQNQIVVNHLAMSNNKSADQNNSASAENPRRVFQSIFKTILFFLFHISIILIIPIRPIPVSEETKKTRFKYNPITNPKIRNYEAHSPIEFFKKNSFATLIFSYIFRQENSQVTTEA